MKKREDFGNEFLLKHAASNRSSYIRLRLLEVGWNKKSEQRI